MGAGFKELNTSPYEQTLLVTDIDMLRMDGIELVKKVRAEAHPVNPINRSKFYGFRDACY